jgi:hypothetical protein
VAVVLPVESPEGGEVNRFPEVAVEAFDGPLGNLPTTCTVGHLR